MKEKAGRGSCHNAAGAWTALRTSRNPGLLRNPTLYAFLHSLEAMLRPSHVNDYAGSKVKHSIRGGRYMTAVARMEHTGVPTRYRHTGGDQVRLGAKSRVIGSGKWTLTYGVL
jgi:hypothetical protein